MRTFCLFNDEVALLAAGTENELKSTACLVYGRDEIARFIAEHQLPTERAKSWLENPNARKLPEKATRPTETFTGIFVTDIVTQLIDCPLPIQLVLVDELMSPEGHLNISALDDASELSIAFFEGNDYVLMVVHSKEQAAEALAGVSSLPDDARKTYIDLLAATAMPERSDVPPQRVTGLLAKMALRISMINSAYVADL